MTTIRPFENAGGFTTFENTILDYVMPACKPNTWKILCVAIRLTKGWNKDSDKISITQFQKKSGIGGRKTTIDAVSDAVASGYLIRIEGYTNSYSINRRFEIETSSEIELVLKQNQTRFRNRTKTGSEIEPTKDKTKNKESIQLNIPEPINTPEFVEAWRDWLEYRKESKHKITTLTANKQLKKLATYPVAVAIGMIEQSIENGWQGLFALKENGKKNGGEIIRNPDGSLYV